MIVQELNIESRIFDKIKRRPAGTLFFPEQFRGFGKNSAIRKALQRLVEGGKITRVAQGMYVLPKESSLIGKILPGAEEIAITIAKRDKAAIIPTGVQALNLLGLSTQIPMKVVYLTNGAARIVRVGQQTIKFKKTTPKNLLAKGPISSLVIQALKEIGKDNATEQELNKIMIHLKNEKEGNIIHDSKLAPVWIANILIEALVIEK